MNIPAHEFRIGVEGLRTGMFVSRLDRPWLTSPFPLEGVLIQSPEELAELRRLCSYVYVDTRRGIAPDLRYIQMEPETPRKPDNAQAEFTALRKTTWQIRSTTREEMPRARHAHAELRQGISQIMHDLEAGHALKVEKLRDSVNEMVDSITRNPSALDWLREIKRSDNYAYHHALACSIWAASFGRHLGLDRKELVQLTLAGLLFDVGKIRLDPAMLSSRTVYGPEGRASMQAHVQHSLDILAESDGKFSSRMLGAVATHHERHDGSGYPQGLAGSAIPIYGRILGIIDSYEAMTSGQPYMRARSPHQAVMDLYESRGTLYQPELVEQFIQTCGIYPTGSLVELSDRRVGVITAVHNLKRLRPSVMVLLDANKKPLAEFETIDLWQQSKVDGSYPLSVKNGLAQGAYGIDSNKLFLD